MTIKHNILPPELRVEVKARHCKMGHLYYDEKDTIGVYTPVEPCDVVNDAVFRAHMRHFVVFHDGLPTQGSLVHKEEIMIEVGELNISVA